MLMTVGETGGKEQASRTAIPIDLSIKYILDHNKKPIIYIQNTADG